MREKLNRILKSRFELRNYSRLGFASFVAALVCGLVVIFEIILVLTNQNNPLLVERMRVLDPWITWAIVLLAVAGIIMGLAGTAQDQKKKIFGQIGLIFNGLFLVGIFVLYLSNTIAFWKLAAGG
jgi:hypothetical protein